jgi:hypothetical protein
VVVAPGELAYAVAMTNHQHGMVWPSRLRGGRVCQMIGWADTVLVVVAYPHDVAIFWTQFWQRCPACDMKYGQRLTACSRCGSQLEAATKPFR